MKLFLQSLPFYKNFEFIIKLFQDIIFEYALLSNLLSITFNKWILFLLLNLFSFSSHSYLTSDADLNLGVADFTIFAGESKTNLNSTSVLDFNYNLNNSALNNSFNMTFNETFNSSQGALSWTRIGIGSRLYFLGFNGLRVIFDNKIEGTYLRPTPYLGLSVGLNNFSIQSIDGTSGYFNAVSFDFQIRMGIEIVINPNLFLNFQSCFISGEPTVNPKNNQTFSFRGMAFFLGLKTTVDGIL